MRNTLCIVIVLALAVALIGCGDKEVKKKHHIQYQQPASGPGGQPAPLPDTSEPDWTQKTVQADGQCAANPVHAANPAQQKLMARRGALQDARRMLLEQVLGLQLDSKTVVKDMVTQKDDLKAKTSGFIREAKVIGENYAGGIYTVRMELKLYTVYTYMKKKKIYYK